MTREKYESLPLSTLKEVAKTRGLRGISTMKKADLIDLMLEEDDKVSIKEAKEEVKSEKAGTADIEQLDSGRTVNGILEVMDGYGFIRSQNYLPGDEDVYVSPSQIRRFSLKTGDILTGNTRVKTQSEKFSALLYLTKINGMSPAEAGRRMNFENMTPIFPNERLRLEAGKKYHIQMILDDTIATIYVDGVALNTRFYQKFGQSLSLFVTDGTLTVTNAGLSKTIK